MRGSPCVSLRIQVIIYCGAVGKMSVSHELIVDLLLHFKLQLQARLRLLGNLLLLLQSAKFSRSCSRLRNDVGRASEPSFSELLNI